jgi:hypothetical protein
MGDMIEKKLPMISRNTAKRRAATPHDPADDISGHLINAHPRIDQTWERDAIGVALFEHPRRSHKTRCTKKLGNMYPIFQPSAIGTRTTDRRRFVPCLCQYVPQSGRPQILSKPTPAGRVISSI